MPVPDPGLGHPQHGGSRACWWWAGAAGRAGVLAGPGRGLTPDVSARDMAVPDPCRVRRGVVWRRPHRAPAAPDAGARVTAAYSHMKSSPRSTNGQNAPIRIGSASRSPRSPFSREAIAAPAPPIPAPRPSVTAAGTSHAPQSVSRPVRSCACASSWPAARSASAAVSPDTCGRRQAAQPRQVADSRKSPYAQGGGRYAGRAGTKRTSPPTSATKTATPGRVRTMVPPSKFPQ